MITAAPLRAHGARTLVLAALVAVPAGSARAQLPADPPFAAGERLVYEARAGRLVSAHAEMWIEGPVDLHGVPALLLRFRVNTRVGPFAVSDETSSWVDPARMATLRFEKHERHLLARHSEEVDVNEDGGSWRAADGRTGTTASRASLDELSFIYALRAMSLPLDSTVRLDRHFDADRNPTLVRFTGRDTVETAAGTFVTREVEMRVRDARHYHGEGVIRFSFSDDACRRPVRIVSTIPDAGRIVLTLASAAPERPECAARSFAAAP